MLEVKEQIEKWLEPALQDGGIFLVEIKVLLGGKRIEVFLDTDHGIGIDQCANISRQLEKHLEASDLVPENYLLEVSSPGISNPLKTPRQFKKRVGSVLEVWQADGSFIEGKLMQASDVEIVLEKIVKPSKKKKKNEAEVLINQQDLKVKLKYNNIKKALLQLNW